MVTPWFGSQFVCTYNRMVIGISNRGLPSMIIFRASVPPSAAQRCLTL